MKLTKKQISIAIVICVLIGVLIGVNKYNQPHIDVQKEVAHFQMSSEDLMKAFEKDEAKANLTYLEKIIEVSGTVSEVNLDGTKAIVILAIEHGVGSVQCHFKLENKEELKSILINESILVKGICTGYLMDVILVNSVLINKTK